MKFEAKINGTDIPLEIDKAEKTARLGDRRLDYTLESLGDGRYLLRTGLTTHVLDNISVNDKSVEFTINGKWIKSDIKDEQTLLLEKLGFKVGGSKTEGSLNAPMPGKILNILVNEGEEVAMGDPVVVLEAMKMENELKAPVGGAIARINVEVGQSVEKNHVILEIEPVG